MVYLCQNGETPMVYQNQHSQDCSTDPNVTKPKSKTRFVEFSISITSIIDGMLVSNKTNGYKGKFNNNEENG